LYFKITISSTMDALQGNPFLSRESVGGAAAAAQPARRRRLLPSLEDGHQMTLARKAREARQERMRVLQVRLAEFDAKLKEFAIHSATRPDSAFEICEQADNTFILANVCGCGACAFHAFIANRILKLTDIVIPHCTGDEGAHRLVAELKELLLEFCTILETNQRNADFIASILVVEVLEDRTKPIDLDVGFEITEEERRFFSTFPASTTRKLSTLQEYGAMIRAPNYYGTDSEFRLMAILFRVQINVFRDIRAEVNQLQALDPTNFETHHSYVGSGMVIEAPAENHYNIFHSSAHYQVAYSIPNTFPPVLSVFGEITM
jgi:hypothetical protein